MNRRAILKFLPLVLAAYVLLAAGLHLQGHRYFTLLLQAVKLEVSLLTRTYEPDELSAQWENLRHIVYSKVTRTTPVTDAQGRVFPWLQFENRTMIDGFYVFHLLILPLVLAWPYGSLRRRALGFCLGLLLATSATLIETPYLLMAEWDNRLGLSTWTSATRKTYLHYMEALGGRQFLSLLLAGTAIVLTFKLTSPSRS